MSRTLSSGLAESLPEVTGRRDFEAESTSEPMTDGELDLMALESWLECHTVIVDTIHALEIEICT